MNEFYFMILLSISFLILTHPVALLVSILMQTFIICFHLWMKNFNSWFSFILFLIFLGGLMILFVYTVSLASNEKFENKINLLKMILFIPFLMLIFYSDKTFMETSILHNLSLILSKNMLWVTSIVMIYLFLTLVVAVKISAKTEGPLRNILI